MHKHDQVQVRVCSAPHLASIYGVRWVAPTLTQVQCAVNTYLRRVRSGLSPFCFDARGIHYTESTVIALMLAGF